MARPGAALARFNPDARTIQPANGAATNDETTLAKIAAEIHNADPVSP